MSGPYQYKKNSGLVLSIAFAPGSTSLAVLSRLLLASSVACVCAQAQAQAGSRPAQFFDSSQTFYHSLTGSAPGRGNGGGASPLLPAGVLALAPSTHYLLWVELEQGRLNVMENLGEDGVVIRKRIPISIGKHGIGKRQEGDNKTPIGIYRIENFLADADLDDFYGRGAYPLNYPNALDQLQAHTGHGIWLHGLPKLEKERPFLTSEGCVVIDNDSLVALADEIGAGATMVLSSEELQWVPSTEHAGKAESLQQALAAWESAWESRNSEDYLAFYANDFSDLHRNKSQWSTYKQKINAEKSFIEVEVADVSMLVEPAQPGVVNVVFRQKYASDNYRWQGEKQQLWRQDAQGWKIIYEGDYF